MKAIKHIGIYTFLACLIALGLFSCTENKTTNEEKISSHPRLLLTAQSVKDIRSNLGQVPLFDKTLEETKAEIDAILDQPIDVPVPKDPAGGYTHERHKNNYFELQKAGVLYQITGDEKYAIFVRNMFMGYADLIPNIGPHPAGTSYAPGKLFWQCLNDANWLIYAAQAYDCIYDFLSPEDRALLEKNVFRPMADYLSVDSQKFFVRIHNHSAYGSAAVGMIGFVMQDQELIDRALYGLKNSKIGADEMDNDGAFIRKKGIEKFGFFALIDHLFSPDGYYTEGPYYQRYAMYPFMIFAVAIENNMPEEKIFAYRDSVLVKAVSALINLSDADGDFFPLNDSQKKMSYRSRELVAATDIVYQYGGQSPEFLSIAQEQERVLLDKSGMSVAKGIADGKSEKFQKTSIELRDGSDGTEGAVGVLRSDNLELIMKYSSQGESHGHYDKLTFALYNEGEEVLQDYGFARFVNIEQKKGGGYLPEGKTYAKQTIAHNTLVVNETSHFEGKYEIGEKHHSVGYVFDAANEKIQVVSATEENAYPGVKMHRTMAVIKDDAFENPLVLDLFRAVSDQANQYDLPFYYIGQLIGTNVEIDRNDLMRPLGTDFGYQHLWKESSGKATEENFRMTWLGESSFYSLTSAVDGDEEIIFTMIGANDPKHNLRRQPGIILRKKDKKNTLYASVIETHGSYNALTEIASNAFSSVANIQIIQNDEDYTAVIIESLNNEKWIFAISNKENSREGGHRLNIVNNEIEWVGPYYFNKL